MSMTTPTTSKGLLTGSAPKQSGGLLTNGQAQAPNPDLEYLSSLDDKAQVKVISPAGEEKAVNKQQAAALVEQGWKIVKEQEENPEQPQKPAGQRAV
jgi:hypothetical protein